MWFSTNLLLQKRGNQSGNQKMVAGKDKSSDQKKKKQKTHKQKGKKEHEGNRLTKTQDLPAENRN